MKLIVKLVFNIYLWLVLIIVFIPISLIVNFFHLLKKTIKSSSKESYFSTVISVKNYPIYMNIRWYSVYNFCLLIVLTPCLLLSRYIPKKLFVKKQKAYQATPNQAAALVISQLIGNVRIQAAIAENLNSEYIFALQPTLMDTGPIANDDEAILKMRKSTTTWGFADIDFFKVYYSKLRDTLSKDKKLKNKFLDLSKMFIKTKEQRLVDLCHIGNKGQEECANELAEEIFRRIKR